MIVENIKTWRSIQENFKGLLNGLVDELTIGLNEDNRELIDHSLRAMHESFEGKRLAIESELKKSKI